MKKSFSEKNSSKKYLKKKFEKKRRKMSGSEDEEYEVEAIVDHRDEGKLILEFS